MIRKGRGLYFGVGNYCALYGVSGLRVRAASSSESMGKGGCC